eukprot:ctg_44.g19
MPPGTPTAPAPAATTSRLLLAVDVLLASRALYGFLKSYFRWRLERQTARERQAAAVREQRERQSRRPVRIYLDGCFDLMHYGHANAIRQAASLGDELVVGVCSDAEITCHKGPPVMAEEERYEAVEAVKWVDQVIRGVPYLVTAEFLDKLVREYHIDYVVHGDDPCIGADGRDVYEAVKRADKFRTIARTEGVSSTDIVGRMLLCTTSHHLPRPSSMDGEMANRHRGVEDKSASPDAHVTSDAGERASRANCSTDTAFGAQTAAGRPSGVCRRRLGHVHGGAYSVAEAVSRAGRFRAGRFARRLHGESASRPQLSHSELARACPECAQLSTRGRGDPRRAVESDRGYDPHHEHIAGGARHPLRRAQRERPSRRPIRGAQATGHLPRGGVGQRPQRAPDHRAHRGQPRPFRREAAPQERPRAGLLPKQGTH